MFSWNLDVAQLREALEKMNFQFRSSGAPVVNSTLFPRQKTVRMTALAGLDSRTNARSENNSTGSFDFKNY